MQLPEAQPSNGSSGPSVFGRLSGVLHPDKGTSNSTAVKLGSSPRREGSQFADLRTRLSSRFRSSSSLDPGSDI
jgi:hypothetical protein